MLPAPKSQPKRSKNPVRRNRLRRRLRQTVLGLLTAVTATVGVGCHRQFYRKQADCEAYQLLSEKSSHLARPAETSFNITPDRRSRMFNPFDLDFQPIPLDDPAANRYLQCVDGRRGYPMWEAAGVTNTAESPDWWQFLPLDDDGVLTLNDEVAMRLALLHSPQYQSQLEELYLAALRVSAQRFEFDTQLFGGKSVNFFADGPLTTNGANSQVTVANSGPGGGWALQRRFATGSDLVIGLANSIVWEFSGNDSSVGTTLLDFTFTQPLLRAAGRDVVLENLTLAERDLLANVRAFERFRRSFNLNIAIGRNTESTVSSGNPIVNVSQGVLGVDGFLGLLQTELTIRNSEQNIARLEDSLVIQQDSLVESLTTIDLAASQILTQKINVAQSQSRLIGAQRALIGQQARFQQDIDGYLRDLGLPPYLCTRLDDPRLKKFELISAELLSRSAQLTSVRRIVGELNLQILAQTTSSQNVDTGRTETQLIWTPEVQDSISQLRQALQPVRAFTQQLVDVDVPGVQSDLDRLVETLPKRKAQNERLINLYRQGSEELCSLLNVSSLSEEIFDISDLEGEGQEKSLDQELTEAYQTLSERVIEYRRELDSLQDSLRRYVEEGPDDDDPVALAE
ncbi:MAG: hypothetical protein AAGA03_08930, partial [Planctomycetota bacterium]